MDTNFQMMRKLNKEYKPENFGIASAREVKLIKDRLCLDEMNILQLRNLRDFTILFFSRENSTIEDSDKMSAIVAVIDNRIFRLGGEV